MSRSRLIASIAVLLAGASVGANGPDLRLVEGAKRADTVAVRALLKQGLDWKATAADGATGLHWAAYAGASDMAEALIRAGAPLNAVNDLGVTPLWVASSGGHTSVMRVLLTAGADPNLAPGTGGTPLMIAGRM